MQRSFIRGSALLLGMVMVASTLGCGPGITHTVRLEVGHAAWQSHAGDAINTTGYNGIDVDGSVELSFEDSGVRMLEMCGTGKYWFGGYDYSADPSQSVSTDLPIVSWCTELDLAGDRGNRDAGRTSAAPR